MEVVLRSINLALGALVFLWLFGRRIRHPDWYPRGGLRREIWQMAFFWDLALLVGTIEQLFNTGTSIRIGFTLAAVSSTLIILVRPASDWPGQNGPHGRHKSTR